MLVCTLLLWKQLIWLILWRELSILLLVSTVIKVANENFLPWLRLQCLLASSRLGSDLQRAFRVGWGQTLWNRRQIQQKRVVRAESIKKGKSSQWYQILYDRLIDFSWVYLLLPAHGCCLSLGHFSLLYTRMFCLKYPFSLYNIKMGREKRQISSRESVFIPWTKWLSLVMEIHTLALAPQKLSWLPIPGLLGLPRCLTAPVSSIVLSFFGEEKCTFHFRSRASSFCCTLVSYLC